MQITFNKLRYKNFLSTGNQFINIQLDKTLTTIVTGKNGAGKSTILDAIFFGLFKKAFRNVNIPQLVNSINGADCVVEIEFQRGSNEYKIIRGIKPNIFEIYENGKLLNQDAASKDYQAFLEEKILCMNERVCRQVVLLGSADYKPFMQLPASQRREIVEELLDIKIFSQMLEVSKDQQVILKDQLKDIDHQITLIEEKIKLQQQNGENLKKDVDARKVTVSQEILNYQVMMDDYTTNLVIMQKTSQELNVKYAGNALITKAISDLEKLSTTVATKYASLNDTIQFFQNNPDCPTCKQSISDDHKDHICKTSTIKLHELTKGFDDIQDDIAKKNEALKKFQEIGNAIIDLGKKIYKRQTEIDSCSKYINVLNKELTELSANKLLDDNRDAVKDLEKLLLTSKTQRLSLLEDRQYHEVVAGMLKDGGIKTKIIAQYVPVMNKIINEYLNRFGLPVQFSLDNQFNETIKSRYRDNFSYNNFSEGEKQRIDMALLLTWRQIAKLKNTTNTNLLFLDETFDSSLDSNATDELLTILLESDKSQNIFVISHKTDMSDKMRAHIEFVKNGNFTEMKQRV